MAAEPTKIEIEVLEGKNKGKFNVSYNPPEYSVTKSAQIAEIGIPGLDSPILQFIRGTSEEITLRIFFDTTEEGKDVREETENFYQLVKIDSELHAPPICRLKWGGQFGGSLKEKKFTCIATNITQRFTLFKSDGTPIRAELDVTFKEHKTLQEQLEEIKLQSSDHSKIRKVKRGDTISGLAAEEYSDPTKWREIAVKNKILNPRVLVPGQTLEIPPLKKTP